jgi:hypothetical protein
MRILILLRVCASILSIAARTVLAPLKIGTTTSINGSLRAILSGQQVRPLVNDYFCRFSHLMLWQNWVTAVPARSICAEAREWLGHDGPDLTLTLVANSPADQAADWSAAKRETRVLATEMPANHSATRTKLMAAAVITCWRCVLARPM